MKKLFTLAAALVCTLSISAQTVKIMKTDGSTLQLQANEIDSIVFEPATPSTIVFNGNDTVTINNNAAWTYIASDLSYTITTNSDGTINLTKPEEVYANTVIGTITQSSYTISNIAYDEEADAYVRDYAADKLTTHVTAVNGGKTTMNADYVLTTGKVTVKLDANGNCIVTDTYRFGKMPFPISSRFKGISTAVK